METLDFVSELDFQVLVPGHSEIGDKRSVSLFGKRLGSLVEGVNEKMGKGYGRNEIAEMMRYDDIVHKRYPRRFSDIFETRMQENIKRVYDKLGE